jgi:hypothetical protein
MDNRLEKILKSETKERADVICELEGFLLNPGRFSVLIIGMRGTGKSYWLELIQSSYSDDKHLSGLVMVNAALAKNSNQDYWSETFKKANMKLMIVEDVEKLSKESQEILFDGLSTGHGAKYGFDEKKFEFRIAFTSTFDIKTLRDTEEYLSHKFFDRISQFVVKLPSYTDLNQTVWKDFQLTWKKMKFETNNDLPGLELKTWLEEHSQELHGHFRDLDKIAINWHHCRISGRKENEILSLVTEDFREWFHFPEHKSELFNAFHIDDSLDWEGNMRKFKKYYKEWVKVEYGSLRKGEKKSGVSYRTMERW